MLTRIRRLLRPRLTVIAALLVVATLGCHAGRWWWGFELLRPFVLQYAVAAVVVAAALVWLRAWIGAGAAACALVINLVRLAPLYGPEAAPAAQPDTTPVAALAYNLNSANDHLAEVTDYVQQERPEVVALLEISHLWAEHVSARAAPLHVSASVPRADNFGIMVLTADAAATSVVHSGPGDLPYVETTITRPEGSWTFYSVHPPPPISATMTAHRDALLAEVAERCRGRSRVVVLGDFNATHFSPALDPLLDAGLTSSQIGRGWQSSWPQRPWPLAPFRIPIDHLWHSNDLTTRSRMVGPAMGSDHRPLLVGLTSAPAG